MMNIALETRDFAAFEDRAQKFAEIFHPCMNFTFFNGAYTFSDFMMMPPKKDSFGVWHLYSKTHGVLAVTPKKTNLAEQFTEFELYQLNQTEWKAFKAVLSKLNVKLAALEESLEPWLNWNKGRFVCTKFWRTKDGHFILLNDLNGGIAEFQKIRQKEETKVEKPDEEKTTTEASSVDSEQIQFANEIKGWNFWNNADNESDELVQFMVELQTLASKSDPLVSDERAHYLNYQNWLKDLRLARTQESIIRFFNRVPDCVCHEVQAWLNTIVGQAYANLQAKK